LIRAAIFDYGDTLVRRSPAPHEKIGSEANLASYRLLSRAGLNLPFEEFVAIEGSIFRKFAQIEAAEDRDIPDIIKYRELVGMFFAARSEAWRRRVAGQANRAFWKVVVRNFVPDESAGRSLRELKSMGLRMAVLSNHHNHRVLVEHLKRLGLNRYFLRVLSSDQLGVRKPDPRAFARCLSALRVRSEETIFIGDSLEKDVAGAKACGMKTILVEGGSQRRDNPPGLPDVCSADFKVRSLAGIPRIVRVLNET
jgi:HAD superfamily hydrolase (TIGR01662 family)